MPVSVYLTQLFVVQCLCFRNASICFNKVLLIPNFLNFKSKRLCGTVSYTFFMCKYSTAQYPHIDYPPKLQSIHLEFQLLVSCMIDHILYKSMLLFTYRIILLLCKCSITLSLTIFSRSLQTVDVRLIEIL